MKIIACIDDSDYGHHAFVTAMSLMNKEKDELVILGVAEMMKPPPASGAYQKYLDTDKMNAEIERVTKTNLVKYAAEAEKMGIKRFRSRLRKGDVRQQILEEAKNADLVVMGRRGRNRLDEVLLSSTTRWAIRALPCSVLVVKGTCEECVVVGCDDQEKGCKKGNMELTFVYVFVVI